MAEFAKIFKKLRLERELSQSRLADQLGISKSAVNMYERGDLSLIHISEPTRH